MKRGKIETFEVIKETYFPAQHKRITWIKPKKKKK
jgi:hypothetical protein